MGPYGHGTWDLWATVHLPLDQFTLRSAYSPLRRSAHLGPLQAAESHIGRMQPTSTVEYFAVKYQSIGEAVLGK